MRECTHVSGKCGYRENGNVGYLCNMFVCYLDENSKCIIEEKEKIHSIEQAIYKKAAKATIKKLNAVMNAPAYEFESTLSEYKEYLIRTYHLEKEFPKGESED